MVEIVGYSVAVLFVAAVIALNAWLRRRDREGHWDKEGHGTPEHQDPGLRFRPLEVPPSEPFD